MTSNTIQYHINKTLTIDQFIDVLVRSSLGERRPISDRSIIEAMLSHSNLMVSAWDDDLLVGISRTLTDFLYIGYLSDLAVDKNYQNKGIGKEMIRITRGRMGPNSKLLLLAAPAAVDYYPRIGFKEQRQAWILAKSEPLI